VTVVDVVSSVASADEFPGIYADHLDETCWSDDSKRVVLSSLWRSSMELLMVHVETGQVTRLTNDLSVGSWNLLDIRKDLMLAACSSPSQPPYLVIGKLPAVGEPMAIKWLRLDSEPEPLPQVVSLFSYSVIQPVVYFNSGSRVLCSLEGNHRFCITLAMHHGLSSLSTYRLSGHR